MPSEGVCESRSRLFACCRSCCSAFRLCCCLLLLPMLLLLLLMTILLDEVKVGSLGAGEGKKGGTQSHM